MKKYIIIIAALLGLTLVSCKKFLDTKPTDFLNPGNYYQTEAELRSAAAGVYSILGNSFLHGYYALYLYGWQADEGYMNRATLTSGPWNYFYTASDTYNAGFWRTLWDGINRANVVLSNIDNNKTIPQARRNAISGEMLFLRAYYYFMLVQFYGGVPLKLEPTSSIVNVDIARASAKEVYDQIVKDMQAAEPLLPEISTLGHSGSISKSTVQGMLARVNLFMAGAPLNDKSRFAEALKWTSKVVNSGLHDLNPSYSQVFINLASDRYDTKESLWEVEFWGNGQDQYVEGGRQGHINGPLCTNPATGRGDSYISITSKLYNSFENGDARLWWNVAHFTYTATGVNGAKTLSNLPATEAAKNLLRPAKWRREYEPFAGSKNPLLTPQNVPLLRYSDVLLMHAEALNEVNNGPTAEAIEAVNKVRRRGWTTGIRTISVTNGGTGYTTAPTVNIAGAARAVATVTAGRVTAVTLVRDSTGVKLNQDGAYTTPPVITFTGVGTGAAATATIFTPRDAELTTAQTANKDAFTNALRDERFRELNGEGLRKGDLLRWGIFLQVNRDMGNMLQAQSPGQFFVRYFTNVTDRDLLMPIPVGEMTNNARIVQNPGWN